MNIYDIAKLSGVSIATVSRVLNNSSSVSETTRDKVMKVLDSSNYTPNVFARGLGIGSMKAIGIICPDISDAFMAEAISFLEQELKSHGYSCIVGCSGHALEEKINLTNFFISQKVDALIMVGSTYAEGGADDRNTDYLLEVAKQTPIFLINAYIEGTNIYCSTCDDFKATYSATEKLIKDGRRDILFLYDAHSHSAMQKMNGYKKALKKENIPVRDELILYTKNNIQYTKQLLLDNPALNFDAVLAIQDNIAIGALKYAHTIGKSVPANICVIGYNNSQLAISCEPELTSIDNHLEQLCKNTIATMLRVLDDEDNVAQVLQMEPNLVERASTDFGVAK